LAKNVERQEPSFLFWKPQLKGSLIPGLVLYKEVILSRPPGIIYPLRNWGRVILIGARPSVYASSTKSQFFSNNAIVFFTSWVELSWSIHIL